MQNFVLALQLNDPSLLLTDTAASLASHKIVFAAELARREGRVVNLAEFDALPGLAAVLDRPAVASAAQMANA